MCSEELGEFGSNLSNSDFISILHDIASTTIPRNKCKPKMHNKAWFNDECRSAVLDRKKALRKVRASPTAVSLEQYKILELNLDLPSELLADILGRRLSLK